ncbi:MAG: hypothetical protein ABEJ59_06005 [Halanaeroarchaeum sp.]
MAWFSWRAMGDAVGAGQFLAVWFVATVAYGAGDVVTTIAVVGFDPRLVEANPLLRASYHLAGVPGIVVVKFAVFAVCLAISVYGVRSADRLRAEALEDGPLSRRVVVLGAVDDLVGQAEEGVEDVRRVPDAAREHARGEVEGLPRPLLDGFRGRELGAVNHGGRARTGGVSLQTSKPAVTMSDMPD